MEEKIDTATPKSIGEALSAGEQRKLMSLETAIGKGIQTFCEVGTALAQIRDERLYRAVCGTFEEYCRERWGMTRQYANRLIGSAQVVINLETMVSKNAEVPKNERQMKPLTSLPPEQQRAAWKEAVETAPDGRVTAKHVATVVGQMKKPAPYVRDGEGLKRSMPAFRLREYLLTVNVGSKGRAYKRLVTSREMLAKSITAWNAYRRGESTELKYYNEKPIPKAV